MRACRIAAVAVVGLLFALTVCAALSANIWLSKWTDEGKGKPEAGNNTAARRQIRDMTIYSSLGFAQGKLLNVFFINLSRCSGFLSFSMQLTQKLAAYGAGRKLHFIILMGVVRAPMSFFDTTPIGRIINRFAKDIDSVDTALPNAFTQGLTALVTVVTTLIVLVYGSWFAIIVFVPLAFLFAYIQVC